MRDRLIELLQEFADGTITGNGHIVDGTEVNLIADYLLANGVIVPPCKVGDTVYIIDEAGDEGEEDYVLAVRVLQFFINENGIAVDLKLPLGLRQNTWMVVGKNVFLTKEEAEQALAKMKGEKE